VDNEFESIWKEVVKASSRYYYALCLYRLQKIIEDTTKDSQDLKQASPEHKSDGLSCSYPCTDDKFVT
jgi:hypothetical protein